MDKQPVGTLPDLTASSLDDEIMIITDSEHNQLKKEKISDFITDLTSTDENNALTKGTDGKMFVTDFGNASNITEGTLPTSVLPEIPLEKIPDIPKDKLPSIETSDLPVSGVAADTYAYPSSVTVNAQGQVTAIEEGTPSGSNADTDLSNLTATGEKHFLNKTQITNCILEAPNGVATFSGSNITLKQGLKMLYPNGRNIDKTLKNGELTLDSDTILDFSAYSGQTFDFELMFGCNINDSFLSQNYQESDVAPTHISGRNQIYLNTTENQMYFYYSNPSSWNKRTLIKLGKGRLENGVVTSFTPYQPVELVKKSDIFSNHFEQYIQDSSRKMLLLTNNYIDIAFDKFLTAEADGYATIISDNMHAAAQIAAYVFTPDGNTGIGNQHTAAQGTSCQGAMFIPKGNKYKVWANGGNLKYARFYYCETGEK